MSTTKALSAQMRDSVLASDGVLDALLAVGDWERAARNITSPAEWALSYGDPDSPDWSTHASNVHAYSTVKLRPRVLRGPVRPTLETTILGTSVDFPVLVGPTGGQALLGPEAELATAVASGRAGTAFVLSGAASCEAGDVAAAASGPWWQQVFVFKKFRAVTEYQVRRAVDLGASAIVLTVSHAAAPWAHQRRRHRFASDEVPPESYPPAQMLARYDAGKVPSMQELLADVDRDISWSDVDWLRSLTDKPLIVKGIQTAEDATICLEHGVDGLVVSNHGGRFLQGTRGTFEALPEVVQAVDGQVEVLLDGGIRRGEDVLKAMAAGARGVLIGRASRWGLRVAGTRGLETILAILRQELEDAMCLCGVRSIADIDESLISRTSMTIREA